MRASSFCGVVLSASGYVAGKRYPSGLPSASFGSFRSALARDFLVVPAGSSRVLSMAAYTWLARHPAGTTRVVGRGSSSPFMISSGTATAVPATTAPECRQGETAASRQSDRFP